ncbi:hypothetical protein AMK15_28605 [Streptomyces sp. MJM1172]|nr:hypothetical protein AMK15_28605 [Streptomyces sp. MJM1172]
MRAARGAGSGVRTAIVMAVSLGRLGSRTRGTPGNSSAAAVVAAIAPIGVQSTPVQVVVTVSPSCAQELSASARRMAR